MLENNFKRDLDFLFEVGSLRNVPRGWQQHFGIDCANDLEHTLRVVWLALVIARYEGGANEEKLMKMALVHDIAETRTADHSYVQKVYVSADEHRAAHDALTGTKIVDFEDILKEYEVRDVIEAKIVKDADNLDVDIELKELEERGHKLPEKWSKQRRFVRDEKLYTKTAKAIWDVIQTADPSAWHKEMNKWLKIPNAGK